MTEADFQSDVAHLLAVANREIALRRVAIQAEYAQHNGNSRLAFVFTQMFEEEGLKLITSMASRYALAATGGLSRAALRRTARTAIEDMLATAKKLATISNAFGQGHNAVLHREIIEVHNRLDDRLDFEFRAHDNAPAKPWPERHPIGLMVVSAAVGAILQAAASALIGG